MEQRELENGMSGRGALDDESGRVAALLGALPRVEAPANFEFGVKARIAAGQPRRGSLVPFLKLVAPLCLLLVVGAFIVSYSTWPGENRIVQVDDPSSTVAQSATQSQSSEVPPVQTAPPSVSGSSVPEQSGVAPGDVAGGPRRPATKRAADPRLPNALEGNSANFAVTQAPVIKPRGFEDSDIQIGEVLRQLGLEGDFSGAGWKVSSTATNSIGERSGVKRGDVIESIDGRPISQLKSIKGAFAPKAMGIRRDGKSITLNFKN